MFGIPIRKVIHLRSKVETKKILLILDSKFEHWKGTQRFLYELGSNLMSKGYKVVLIENSKFVLPDAPVKFDFVVPFKVISVGFRKFFGVFMVPKGIVNKEKPDIVYAVNLNSLPFIVSTQYKTIFGTHLLNISGFKRNNRYKRIQFNIKKVLFFAIVKFVWRNKNIMIHALNTDQRDWIKKITHNRFPIRVIGNPVDCRIEESIAFLNHAKMNDRFTVLYFGSFSTERGFSEFLSIVRYIDAKQLKELFHFLIVGDGPLRSDAEKLSKLNNNITLLIRPTDEEKRNIMLSSDLFVFPSIIENFSFTAVEAQASGLPCLFSDITPLKNIAIEGKTGYCLSLEGSFEKRFFDKIQDYFQLWHNDYEGYRKMRVEIAEYTRRLCKENVLPQLLEMIESLLQNNEL